MKIGKLAEECGCTTDNIRDWRRRGFLDGIGRKKENSDQTEYDEADLEIIKEALLLARFRLPIGFCFDLAKSDNCLCFSFREMLKKNNGKVVL